MTGRRRIGSELNMANGRDWVKPVWLDVWKASI
jgi:hypothetical protein